MTIYKIIQTESEEVFSAEPLSVGRHTLEYGGASVEVEINKTDNIMVLVDTHRGEPIDVLSSTHKIRFVWELFKETGTKAIALSPNKDEVVLVLPGGKRELNTSLVLKRLDESPRIHGEKMMH